MSDVHVVRPIAEVPAAQVLAEWAPAERYRRTPPVRLHIADAQAEAWRAHYEKLDGHVPAQRLVALPDALVLDKGTIVMGHDVLRENTEGMPVARVLAALDAARPAPVREIATPLLYTSRYGVKNYGHCLTDIIPRVVAAARQMPELQIALHPEFVPTARDALRLLGVDAARLTTLDEQPTLLRQGRYLTPCSANPLTHSPASLALLRECIAPALAEAGAPAGARKLFVTRADARTRHLHNHEAIAGPLRQEGFVEVTTGGLSFAEQIALFAQAEEVVGIAGASLTNLLFCRPGTRVTLLAPSGMAALYFWDLASQLQLDYRIGYFQPGPPSPAPAAAAGGSGAWSRMKAALGLAAPAPAPSPPHSAARSHASLHEDFAADPAVLAELRRP